MSRPALFPLLVLASLSLSRLDIPTSVAQSPSPAASGQIQSDADGPREGGGSTGIIRMDVYVRGDRDSAAQVQQFVDQLADRRPGLEIRVHDLLKERERTADLYRIAKRAGRDKPVLPAFHCCDRTYFGFVDPATSGPQIEQLYTATIYARTTCSRCQKLKAFLPQLKKRWPAIQFQIHDVDEDALAGARWQALCRGAGAVPGLPTIDFARRVLIGYQSDEVSGAEFESLIRQVSGAAAPQPSPEHDTATPAVRRPDQSNRKRQQSPVIVLTAWAPQDTQGDDDGQQVAPSEAPASDDSASWDEFELPEEAEDAEIGLGRAPPIAVPSSRDLDAVDVPLLGRLRVSKLGLPLFTLAVGLVDGFNPCAMWVLVFLLSVLVNVQDRKKILLIAGTFVFVSGLAYFAFMAAWLNLFLLVGIIRPVQIALGLLAVFIGAVNVKDFFAFKKGISLSIPESKKPGLYRRVRSIVNAKYVTVALSGAVALAIVVNLIELLCTAGLPALYTQILTVQELPTWQTYLYLALYIAAYMFDDTLLVGAVIITMSHRKLQEREGRWLKLISGVVILALGGVMLLRPSWLQFGS
ncbi:hypothetical protein FYK55_01255 [Roseiconus nitratireducens]|uniref:Glutaredoxin n=1 Tax=Roseiconus nitratireducens TaxID=2605748 RepID=A0A5M6DNR2_9BACT|nr:hypothetical protein [Roseiconus nitratireducens]KAA5547075.1 hypothetical protein FYK55_01255 [Roseiconus nitratireducens]